MKDKDNKYLDVQQMERAFSMSSFFLNKQYLNELSGVDAISSDFFSDEECQFEDFIHISNVNRLVYNKNENLHEKLTTIVNAAYLLGVSLVSLITSDGERTQLRIGIVDKTRQYQNNSTLNGFIDKCIKGNFPGSDLKEVNSDDIPKLLEEYRDPVISAVSVIPSLRNEDRSEIENYVQGIEKLIDSMDHRKFCILTLADPIKSGDCAIVKDSLESLYSQLSGFETTEISLSENASISNSNTNTEGFSKSVGTSTSVSISHTNSTGWSQNESKGISRNYGAVAMAAAGIAAVGLTVATGGAALPAVAALAAGSAASAGGTAVLAAGAIGALGYGVGGLIGTKTKSSASGVTGGNSDGETYTQQENENKTESYSISRSVQSSFGKGTSVSYTLTNKKVKDILDIIEEQIERIKECGNSGAFSCCTYVITDDIETNMQAASLYNALLSGSKTYLQVNRINTWFPEKAGTTTENILKYLKMFSHPQFPVKVDYPVEAVTAATLISGKELAMQLGFPKKNVNGITVLECAEFGRNICVADKSITVKEKEETISIGKIYHMYEENNNEVGLSVNSFTSHVFVTGSTGTGKSNAIYQIIDLLQKEKTGCHVLIIEPAKGEYKEVFGRKYNVYGTNETIAPLLKLNPFVFPQGIHVLEHVDRLIEILNACWPMYAAMPAVLKDAIEKAYISRGWDLERSVCLKNEYPTFTDVLTELPKVLNTSLYSADTKSDYAGALITRIQSLTNGINGLILCSEYGQSDKELFDSDVIVDISRVGSSETKALLMGILIMRLQEYRMSVGGINCDLKHITVLEEAHNLLKGTSSVQMQEGANLQGKSVEMITNSIAEMRTYGEGFVIVDQAPGLLDEAIIRNTNTKIVFRLPDGNDRFLVGKSIALKDSQIDELAKLPRGVAAVYQNEWLEAVLCSFEKHQNAERYDYKTLTKHILENVFMENSPSEFLEIEDNKVTELLRGLPYGKKTKHLIKKAAKGVMLSQIEKQMLAYNIIGGLEIHDLFEGKPKDVNLRIRSKVIQKTGFDVSNRAVDAIHMNVLGAIARFPYEKVRKISEICIRDFNFKETKH